LTGKGQDKGPHQFLSGRFTPNTAEARAAIYRNPRVKLARQPVLRG